MTAGGEVRDELVGTVREFVDREVIPAAPALDRDDASRRW